MPKYHGLPFFVERICGSRSPLALFVELGAAIRVASTLVPWRKIRPRSPKSPYDVDAPHPLKPDRAASIACLGRVGIDQGHPPGPGTTSFISARNGALRVFLACFTKPESFKPNCFIVCSVAP
ncbi:hypothetical protein [Thiorhodospira sibirica]|uniref:hypothetical protein n=1 Tax=Thiorhodospira sibirica TaxID=154347 RepID=UPI003AB9388A